MQKKLNNDIDIVDLMDISNKYRYINLISYIILNIITTATFAILPNISIIALVISNIIQLSLIISYLNSIKNMNINNFSEKDVYYKPFYVIWETNENKYRNLIKYNSEFIEKNKNIIFLYATKEIKTLSAYSYIGFWITIILFIIIFANNIYMNELFPLNSISPLFFTLISIIRNISVMDNIANIEIDKITMTNMISSNGKSILDLGGYCDGSLNNSEINLLKNRIKLSLKETAKSITILKKNKRNEEVRMIRNIINKLLKPIERFKQIDDKGNEYYNLDYNIVNDVVNMLNTTNSSLSVCIKDTEKDNIETIKKVEKEVDDFLEGTNSIIDKLLLNDISRLKDRIEVEMKVYGR